MVLSLTRVVVLGRLSSQGVLMVGDKARETLSKQALGVRGHVAGMEERNKQERDFRGRLEKNR